MRCRVFKESIQNRKPDLRKVRVKSSKVREVLPLIPSQRQFQLVWVKFEADVEKLCENKDGIEERDYTLAEESVAV